MKVLIIGSKGFIGSYAYKYFLKNNNIECWGCDVVVDYVDTNYFLLDTTNSDFNEIFGTVNFDICINCSGAASVPDSLVHPFRDFTLNTYNVIKILEAIRRFSPQCKFINMSSAAVYGNPASLPITESALCRPISPYGKHKLYAEELCKEYYSFFDVQTCSLRVFSAYGPGLRKQFLWDIYQKAVRGNEVVLFGSGSEARDYIFIEDIAHAIEVIVNKGDFNASIYNIANGIEVTTKEVATKLLKQIDYNGELKFSGSQRTGDPLNWKADIDKLKTLGYVQSFSIEEGIKKYVEWLKEEK